MSKYGVFSDPYFPAFGLNTERYKVSLHIQSECGKYGSEKTPYLDTFHAVYPTDALKFQTKFIFTNLTDQKLLGVFNVLVLLKA